MTEQVTVPKETRFQLWRIMDDQGRKLVWLADRVQYSANHVYHIRYGQRPATPEFRTRCAQVLAIPEDILFSLLPD